MNEEAQTALAELARMKEEMAEKLAAVSQMMAQMKPAPQTTDTQKPDEKPSEPAHAEPAAEPEQNAPQTEPEQTADKPENEPETEAELEPDEDEQTAEPEDNKDGEDKPDEKPADKPEEEKPPKWEWKATNHMEERLKAYFDKNASPELRAKIEGKKTLQGAAKHLYEWAQKKAEKGARGYFAEDEDVFCELMHYFEEDSLNSEWKPAPKPAPYKPAKPYTPPVIPKPAPKKPDPQMTLFDF
jgi:hypothetical protein